jgi:hypothetical protein
MDANTGELAHYRQRVEAARIEVAELPRLGWGEPGPPDEETGERWDRANVLGHMGEMLPFWTDHVRGVLGGATSIGRGDEGLVRRRQGIDGGHNHDEEELLAHVDAGLAGLLTLLDEMHEEDLDRRLLYRSSAGDREVDLRFPIEDLLIAHVEEHFRQLKELA